MKTKEITKDSIKIPCDSFTDVEWDDTWDEAVSNLAETIKNSIDRDILRSLYEQSCDNR